MAAPAPASAEEAEPDDSRTPPASEADEAEPLTTPLRARPNARFDVTQLLLELPGLIIEGVFWPLYPLVYGLERGTVLDRLIDLLTNDARTFGVAPVVDFVSVRSGVGFGLVMAHNEPFGGPDRTLLLGLVRTNGNRQVTFSHVRRMPVLSGRRFSINSAYNSQRDIPFYGLGDDRNLDEQRFIRQDAIDVRFGLTLLDPSFDWDAAVELAYRYRSLAPGEGNVPGLTANDVLTAPPGFGRDLSYPEITASLFYDSRDAVGRTTRGIEGHVTVSATHDVNHGSTGGVRIETALAGFIPLLPLNRVLVLKGGMGAAFPAPGSDDDVAFHQLMRLGGDAVLRSYQEERFVDRIAWWASLEYRWPMFEYGATGYTLSAVTFFDIGNVASHIERIFAGGIPWSLGFAVRAEANLFAVGRVQFAGGPDGFLVSLGLGELP